MRIPSGVTDQVIYFVAVDATDLKTRETGLTTFTVYRSRNGGAATAMTTPTVTEKSAANMPGVYTLLLDEDMTIAAGNDSEEMCFHITQASMAPVTRTIELYRPKITAGNTLDVTSTGGAGIDWSNVENQGTAVTLSSTTVGTTTTNTDMVSEPPTAAAIADQVWDEAKAGHVGAGSFGEEVQAHALTSEITALNDPTAAAIADAVWDETTAGHVTAGTFGEQLKMDVDAILVDTAQIGTAGAGLTDLGGMSTTMKAQVNTECDTALTDYGANTTTPPTAAAIADQVWDEAKAGHVGAGSFGEEIQSHALTSEVSAVETDTQDIQSRLPAALVSGRMSSDAVAISGSTVAADNVEANIGNLDAAISGLNDLAASDILTTALTESYAADGAAATLSQLLYMSWSALSEFAISGTTMTAKKLDGTTTAMTFTLDSASTPTSRTRAT